MDPTRAADILEKANRWRRGEDIPPPDPTLFGQAIDAAVDALREKAKNFQVSM